MFLSYTSFLIAFLLLVVMRLFINWAKIKRTIWRYC